MTQNQTIEQIKQVKTKYEQTLLKLANVVGLGIGFKEENGALTEQIALVVNVSQKKAVVDLSPQDVIPSELDTIVVDVQEVGEFKAYTGA